MDGIGASSSPSASYALDDGSLRVGARLLGVDVWGRAWALGLNPGGGGAWQATGEISAVLGGGTAGSRAGARAGTAQHLGPGRRILDLARR